MCLSVCLSLCVYVCVCVVFIHRANIGRDISPDDDDLIVLFRRNSKEVTSEPAHWSAEHSAVWNQHVDIQTSLLRQKKPQGAATTAAAEFLKKEYEIVLVAVRFASPVCVCVALSLSVVCGRLVLTCCRSSALSASVSLCLCVYVYVYVSVSMSLCLCLL